MYNIAIFASGEGTNAENLMQYFQLAKNVCIKVVISNHADAGVLAKSKKFNVSVEVINKTMLLDESIMFPLLKKYHIDFIILAGFLSLIPPFLVKKYYRRIVNIHPSLIPLHSGKGMYGMHVHEDVVKSCDKETGITIHLVDEEYDYGEILLQKKCKVFPHDTAEDVACRVHALEYAYFPKVIEKYIEEYRALEKNKGLPATPFAAVTSNEQCKDGHMNG